MLELLGVSVERPTSRASKSLERRRHHEYQQRVGYLVAHLVSALHVDLEDGIAPRRERRLDLVARRAVPVGMHLGRFQKALGLHEALVVVERQEVIADAVDLPGRRARVVTVTT